MTAAFVDRRCVRRNFARAAPGYGEKDFLAREIDRRMQERLDVVRLLPGRVVDLGCARGGSLAGLAARYPQAAQVAVDLAPEMLAGLPRLNPPNHWLRRWATGWRSGLIGGPATGPKNPPLALAADVAQLPLKDASAGLVWANLLFHWLDQPRRFLAETHRILETGGLFMFSTLGPDTLRELRSAFSDGRIHTQRFADLHDLGDLLMETGFADPVMEMEMLTLTYDHVDALLADLRGAGGACAMAGRQRGLTGKGVWQKARAAYENLRQAGKLPATVEVIYGHAWKSAAAKPGKPAGAEEIIRFHPPRTET